jgi:hypothetical protein
MTPVTVRFRHALLSFVFLALVPWCLSGCENKPSGPPQPASLEITPSKNLSSEEQEVEARFAKYLKDNTEAAIADYREKYGYVVNTDNARELSKDYAPHGPDLTDADTIASRTKWSAAVQGPASALATLAYKRMLSANTVVFTAGGAGSGKSTAIKGIPTLRNKLANAQIIYDTTLSGEDSSLLRIQQALDAGKKVYIIFVYREPIDALVGGALPRAMEMGRTLSLNAFAKTHLGAPEVLASISKKYNGNSRVEFVVVDNSLGKGRSKLLTEDIKGFFQKHEQTFGQLMPELLDALKKEYQKDAITDNVYNAFMGKDGGGP